MAPTARAVEDETEAFDGGAAMDEDEDESSNTADTHHATSTFGAAPDDPSGDAMATDPGAASATAQPDVAAPAAEATMADGEADDDDDDDEEEDDDDDDGGNAAGPARDSASRPTGMLDGFLGIKPKGAAASSGGSAGEAAGAATTGAAATDGDEEEGVSGNTSFPVSRIRAIMKLDPDTGKMGADAVYLVARSTELFVQYLADKAYHITQESRRKTVMKKDILTAVQPATNLEFLESNFTDATMDEA